MSQITPPPGPPVVVAVSPPRKKYARSSVTGFFASTALIRGLLAVIFVIIFTATCAVALVRASNWTEVKEILDVVFPAEIALLGSAVGYYFGSK